MNLLPDLIPKQIYTNKDKEEDTGQSQSCCFLAGSSSSCRQAETCGR